MLLDVHGHPLHTRALSITLVERADGRLDVRGDLLDLRKRGFVPVGGDLQPSGIVHHMLLDAVADPATNRLDSIRASQPTVAFEPTAVTGGESCRDPIDTVAALAGARLDAGFSRRVSAAVGGPRGCNHILTLAHLLGSTTAWALEQERSRDPVPARVAGQRVFRRDLIVDGHEAADGTLILGLQLLDLHFAPAPPIARPMDRFGRQYEVRALVPVDLRTFHIIEALAAAERRRAAASLTDAPWVMRDDVRAALLGERLGTGITATVFARLGGVPTDRPLVDALLMLAPTLVQCMAALSEGWAVGAARAPTVIGMGGLPDACYMWRVDGPLARIRAAEGAPPPVRPGG